eukprot:TRINITY_DN13411_c0_g1_i1.p1 TRINITY_DN13411_c0_g1~~TRINITY_DN13411_c0_g1_i1.p1  ORF type:complete len:186 (-),score=49.46 TRINITY_DN13411_c0_g1_i1:125-682(-)
MCIRDSIYFIHSIFFICGYSTTFVDQSDGFDSSSEEDSFEEKKHGDSPLQVDQLYSLCKGVDVLEKPDKKLVLAIPSNGEGMPRAKKQVGEIPKLNLNRGAVYEQKSRNVNEESCNFDAVDLEEAASSEKEGNALSIEDEIPQKKEIVGELVDFTKKTRSIERLKMEYEEQQVLQDLMNQYLPKE